MYEFKETDNELYLQPNSGLSSKITGPNQKLNEKTDDTTSDSEFSVINCLVSHSRLTTVKRKQLTRIRNLST